MLVVRINQSIKRRESEEVVQHREVWNNVRYSVGSSHTSTSYVGALGGKGSDSFLVSILDEKATNLFSADGAKIIAKTKNI